MRLHYLLFTLLLGGIVAWLSAGLLLADEPATEHPPEEQPTAQELLTEQDEDAGGTAFTQPAPPPADSQDEFVKMAPPEGLIRLDPEAELWIDRERRIVVVDGQVVLTEGQLEMFACPRRSKEHESVVAVNSKAFLVHAGLLAVGAKNGRPVSYDPEYQPASGTEVTIEVLWIDREGNRQRTNARNWVRNVETNKPLQYNWVFGGSQFWKDEFDGRMHYLAEAGDLICVSNFPSATLDLPIESSQANAALLFEAYTENIPPRGTHVRLVLIPKLDEDAEPLEPEQIPSDFAPAEEDPTDGEASDEAASDGEAETEVDPPAVEPELEFPAADEPADPPLSE